MQADFKAAYLRESVLCLFLEGECSRAGRLGKFPGTAQGTEENEFRRWRHAVIINELIG